MLRLNVAPVHRIARADNWWYSKIPPVLGICFASALIYHVPAAETVLYTGLIVFTGICAGAYGHLINDVFDLEADRKAGKKNHMAAFAPWQRAPLCALAVVLGFSSAAFVRYSAISLALLAFDYLLPTLYSVPGIRLKERGVFGVLADAMGAHVVPTLYVISVLAFAPGVTGTDRGGVLAITFPAVASLWAFFLGVKGIVIHEFQDKSGDLEAGVSTFATAVPVHRLRRLVNRIYILELVALLGMLIVLLPNAPALIFAAAAYAGIVSAVVARWWSHYRHTEDSRVVMQWWWFSNPFYETYLPLVLSLHLAVSNPAFIVLPIATVALFLPNFRHQLDQVRTVSKDIKTRWIWRGRLDLETNAQASVTRPGYRSGITRIEISKAQTEPWQIRLVRPGVTLKAGERYRVLLEMRADRERPVTFGVWQDHQPWDSLGLYQQTTCSPEWTVFEAEFAAAQDDDQAYLGIWVGGHAAAVEVKSCSFFSAPLEVPDREQAGLDPVEIENTAEAS